MVTEFSFRRTLTGTVLIAGAVVLVSAAILGDRFPAWWSAVRGSARDQLEGLVDQPKYRLARAEQAVEKARERCDRLRELRTQNDTLLKARERALAQARAEADESERGLARIDERRKAGEPVRLRGGRALTDDEVELRELDYRNRLQQSREKVRHLEAFVDRCRQRQARFREQAREAPLELAKLELSLTHLAEKTRFYEEQRKLLAAEGNVAAGDELYKEARQTLDRAHAELDAGLAAFDTRFSARDDPDVTPTGADPAP